jgi:hypothetical protein
MFSYLILKLNIKYLMVYTDPIESQIVGDTYANLLRTITKTGEFNRTTEKLFLDPHYIAVTKSYSCIKTF